MSQLRSSLSLLVQSVIGGLAIAFIAILISPQLIVPRQSETAPESGFADAVARVSPAVVGIYDAQSLRPMADAASGGRRAAPGSAVVIDDSGYLLAQLAVFDGGTEQVVELPDGRLARPRLIGTDRQTGLALVQVELADLPVAEPGDSDALRPGDVILAISYSRRQHHSVTLGIVSATGSAQRNGTIADTLIRTDAAIGAGGAALIDSKGRLIGISTVAAGSGAAPGAIEAGLSAALPINLVLDIVEQLIEHGRVIRGHLGVEITDVSAPEAESLGLAGPAVLVESVSGLAQSAGLSAGDILTHMNGQRISGAAQFEHAIAATQPGMRVSIHVVRMDGSAFDIEVVLEESPADPTDVARQSTG